MREVKGLALGDGGLHGRPHLRLGSIRKQVHDDGALLEGLLNGEQVLAWHPAVILGLLPGLAVLSDTNNHVHAVVAGVETLTVALRAVADESKSVVLEVSLELVQRPVSALVDGLLDAGSKGEVLDAASLLLNS